MPTAFRDSGTRRDELHGQFLTTLHAFGARVVTISGSAWDERTARAIPCLRLPCVAALRAIQRASTDDPSRRSPREEPSLRVPRTAAKGHRRGEHAGHEREEAGARCRP